MKFFCVPLFACKGQLVESLDFSGKNLSDLPKEVIKAKKTLEELNLRMNFIEVLPQELFRCTRLKKLDVSENRIKNLPEEISLLGDLMVLNLSKNDLVNLPDQIGQCVNLVSLNLSNNMLSLSKSVMNLTQLTTLNISETSTTTLPAEIDQLVNLQHLDASQCDISSLPNSIVRLSKLKVLDLCENHITELPAQMDKMLSLESLDVRANMLTKIPDKLLQCRELQTLDLSQNNLLDLPNEIGELDRMVELVLCENTLSSLPHSLGNMKRLEVLKITKNTLKTLTPAICRCVNLTDLYLSENLLEELPSSIGNLNKLRFLDVSSNRLKTVPSTIGNCTALGVLALRSNEIRELPMEIGKLASLRVLDLTFNKLDHLPYTVKVLEGLQALWLSIRQPPMPHLTTIELPNKIKALTCCYLPQNEQNSSQPRTNSKSCVGGARVNFSNNANEATIDDDDAKYPIGNFQRYDTPHPKPFAPKNRANRNSADLTGKTAGTSAETQPNPTESRPLRSVLKKRPVSQYAECQLAEERGVLHKIVRDPDGIIGWSIGGGISDHELYKNARGIFVANVRPGGPADRAGIQIDDKIVAVNGTTMSDLNQLDAVRILEEAGAEFEVRIERIPFEAAEPQEKAPVFPQLDAEPRPPSRIGSVVDLTQPMDSNSSQNGTLDLQRAQQKVLELSIDNEPLPPPPKVHAPNTTLPSARSLPSLVEINLFEPNNAPPVPPRRSGSKSNLNPGEFDVQSFLNSLKTKPAPQPPRPTSSLGNKSFEDVAAEVQAANPAISNVEFVDRMDQPLATSSPVPPKSRIPIKNVTNSNNNQSQSASLNGYLNQYGSNAQIRPPSQSRISSGISRPTSGQSNANGRSRLSASQINPPPLAPKPQLTSLPERMDFDSKRRHFEQRINQERAGPSQERPAHPPPKRPLVSGQEIVNNKEVSMDKIPMIDDEAGSSMDRDIQDLLNGNLNIPKQPRQNGNQPNDRVSGLRNQSMDCPSPAPSDISTVSSVLEQRAADFEKQQALRQAKLHSMHKESMEAADLVKLIDRFANSPIPTQ